MHVCENEAATSRLYRRHLPVELGNVRRGALRPLWQLAAVNVRQAVRVCSSAYRDNEALLRRCEWHHAGTSVRLPHSAAYCAAHMS